MSLNNTLMQEYRAKSDHLDKHTARPSRYGAFDVFAVGNNENMSIISPEMEQAALTQVGRALKVPVFDAQNITIGNTRSITIAANDNQSSFMTINFTVLSWGFTQVPTRFINNEIGMQKDFNRKFEKNLFAVGKVVEDLCLAALDTNKSQVYDSLLSYTKSAAHVVTATADQKDRLISDLTPLMNANDFYGGLHVVGNPGMQSHMIELSKNGLYNDKDETISFLDKQFHFTNQLADISTDQATGYAIAPGSVGLLFRPEAEAILATQMADGTAWSMDRLPLLDIPVSTYYRERVVDDSGTHSGTTHLDRVRERQFGYSIEIATVTVHNSDLTTYANPIAKIAIAKPVTQ